LPLKWHVVWRYSGLSGSPKRESFGFWSQYFYWKDALLNALPENVRKLNVQIWAIIIIYSVLFLVHWQCYTPKIAFFYVHLVCHFGVELKTDGWSWWYMA